MALPAMPVLRSGRDVAGMIFRDGALAVYDPLRAARWRELTGNDVRTAVGVFSPQALWMLGYPDRAVQMSDQKDADARHLRHPFDIGWARRSGDRGTRPSQAPRSILRRKAFSARCKFTLSDPLLRPVNTAVSSSDFSPSMR
jgi:hypothetical protein